MIVRFVVLSVVCIAGIALLTSVFPRTLGAVTKNGSKDGSTGKEGGKQKTRLKRVFPTKPLESGAKWSHAPFIQGNCSICHQKDDPKKPGPMKASTNKLCLGCHEPQRMNLVNSRVVHKPVSKDCSYCHNAHNSRYRRLLYRQPLKLCTTCHRGIRSSSKNRSQHDAVSKKRGCKNCHASHSSNSRGLLLSSQYSLCIKCHGKDNVKDDKGRVLVNIKKLGEEKKVHHEPFAKKNCSACHRPHGSRNHRLLVAEYPEESYASFEEETYGLCFKCHEKERITLPETDDMTGFRDGENNLHFVHVIKMDRGRPCRYCHEDHATQNSHLVRESVPYGTSGWKLKLNYENTETGGSCAKTCHDTKVYDNKGIRPVDIAARYKKKSRKESVKEALRIEKEKAEASGEINLNYARKLLKSKKLDKALAQAQEALGKNDRLASAHAVIGFIYTKQKKCDLAELALEKALQLDPKNGMAKKAKRILAKISKRKRCEVTPAASSSSTEDETPAANDARSDSRRVPIPIFPPASMQLLGIHPRP